MKRMRREGKGWEEKGKKGVGSMEIVEEKRKGMEWIARKGRRRMMTWTSWKGGEG